MSASALVGCASPAITVRNVSVQEETDQAVRLTVDVDLSNPADASMRLLQWNYTFSNASGSYSGTWEALTTLPPRTTVSKSIPVVLPSVAGADSWNISGSLTYRSPSRVAEIFYDLGLWRPRTGFGGSSQSAAQPAGQPATPPATPPAGSQ